MLSPLQAAASLSEISRSSSNGPLVHSRAEGIMAGNDGLDEGESDIDDPEKACASPRKGGRGTLSRLRDAGLETRGRLPHPDAASSRRSRVPPSTSARSLTDLPLARLDSVCRVPPPISPGPTPLHDAWRLLEPHRTNRSTTGLRSLETCRASWLLCSPWLFSASVHNRPLSAAVAATFHRDPPESRALEAPAQTKRPPIGGHTIMPSHCSVNCACTYTGPCSAAQGLTGMRPRPRLS